MTVKIKKLGGEKSSIVLQTKISNKLKKLAEKIQQGHTLTKSDTREVETIIEKSSVSLRARFLKVYQEYAPKTEEELLEELQHILVKSETRGKPAESNTDRTLLKVMLAYRLQQRGLNYQQIGEQLKVSEPQVNSYLRQAREYLRIDPSKIDIPLLVGETLNFYEDVRGMALMIASVDKSSSKDKLSAMAVSLQAERDKLDFLARTGVLSPAVVQVFQQVILQQMNLMTEKPIEDLVLGNVHPSEMLSNMAKSLVRSLREKQLIAVETING